MPVANASEAIIGSSGPGPCKPPCVNAPQRFDSERAGDLRAVYAFELAGDGGGAWTLRVADGVLTVEPGGSPEADATIRATADDWMAIVDGRIIEHDTRPVGVVDRTIGRVWTFRDITARVRAFEMLRESEERFRNFADSAAYGIVMHQDGDVVYANAAAASVKVAPRKNRFSMEDLLGSVRGPEDSGA